MYNDSDPRELIKNAYAVKSGVECLSLNLSIVVEKSCFITFTLDVNFVKETKR